MCTEPLADYFAMGGRKPDFQFHCTALWRGYVGCWEILAGRLYLVKLTGTLMVGSDVSLESVFPGFPERVFAHWYTGTIRIPRGQRLHYQHMGYGSVYESDEMLAFEQGVIRCSWVQHNGQATPDDSKPQGYTAGSMTHFPSARRASTRGSGESEQGEQT
jgi:hypothetical protein